MCPILTQHTGKIKRYFGISSIINYMKQKPFSVSNDVINTDMDAQLILHSHITTWETPKMRLYKIQRITGSLINFMVQRRTVSTGNGTCRSTKSVTIIWWIMELSFLKTTRSDVFSCSFKLRRFRQKYSLSCHIMLYEINLMPR